jgi:hypothetical protein
MKLSFFGMIGPNVKTATSLYSLFTSNGILQGVFLNDSTPVSHLIQTDRVRHHQRFGNFYFPGFPHQGAANTAVLSVYDKDYVLFERDSPYEISIDYPSVKTIRKVKTPFTISGHSTFSPPFIHSMTYSILHRSVSFLTLTPTFAPHRIHTVHTTYLPLVHDYLRHRDTYVFTESPISLSFRHLAYLQPHKPTYIHVLPHKYTSPTSFFIFHYAGFSENETAYTLYAPAYDTLSFNSINIVGKYRRFILDKCTRTITIETNPVLESYNLDFPIPWGTCTLLRNLCHDHINGFVLCDGLSIVRTYWVNVSVLGEPYIHENTLHCFATHVYLTIDLLTGQQTHTPIDLPGTLGFHSFAKFVTNTTNPIQK